MESVANMILSEIIAMKGDPPGKVILVVDQLDLLLAAGGDVFSAVALGDMISGFREEAHAMILSLSADYPLVSSHGTTLEAEHAAFLLGIAHEADLTMSLRLLDSGVARDISGVVSVKAGDVGGDHQTDRKIWEDREMLYFVAGDGGVRVFERGQ